MNKLSGHTTENSAQALVGAWRRFGEVGIIYEIIAIEDDKNLKIKVLDTGEELSYPLSQALDDPDA